MLLTGDLREMLFGLWKTQPLVCIGPRFLTTKGLKVPNSEKHQGETQTCDS